MGRKESNQTKASRWEKVPENDFFLFLNQNICLRYLKEPSLWDGSFKHPKYMLKW